MTRVLGSRDYLKKCLGFVYLIVLLSLGAIGGCDGSGNGNPELAVLGNQRDVALSGISSEIQTSQYDGNPTNILLDGTTLGDLTNEEIASIRDAYEAGFVIVIYDASEKDISQIYHDIINDQYTPSGDASVIVPVFAIEKDDNVHWAFEGDFNATNASKLTLDENDPVSVEQFAEEGREIRDWLEDQPSREQQVIDLNQNSSTASRLVDNAGLRSELDKQLVMTKSESSVAGTLLEIASADIVTSTYYVYSGMGSKNPGDGDVNVNRYQGTSYAWIVTADTSRGPYSFLMVTQDYLLQSRNLFVYNHTGKKAVGDPPHPDQGYYLKEFKVSNQFRQTNGSYLNSDKVKLLKGSPETNQNYSQTTTSTVSHTIQGTLTAGYGGNPAAGSGQGSVQGSFSWGTSYTYTTADVSIDNLSTSGKYGNDATWQFLPRRPSAGGTKDACQRFGLRNLADLARTTFTPGTSFVVQIASDYAGTTLNMQSAWTIALERSRIPLRNCAFAGCTCSIDRLQYPGSPFTTVFDHRILIPNLPD